MKLFRHIIATAAAVTLLLITPVSGDTSNVIVLTCADAIDIALQGSYSIRTSSAQKEAMQHYFDYYKSMFKPRLDFSVDAPSFAESVSAIERTDGLPVYNSTGLMQIGGLLKFTYMLPTGGNFALSSELYRENLKTVLALSDYKSLTSRQANSSLSLSFSQPIFTTNTLRENLDEAKYRFESSSSRFTRGQMDIVYRVTDGFFSLYRAIREVEIAEEKLDNSERAYRIATLMYEAGRIPEGDLLITEVEVSRNKAALIESEGSLDREKESFKQLIGLDQEQEINIETDLKYEIFETGADEAVERALANRREVRESELNIKLQEIEVERARRDNEFKGEISAYYDITGVSTTTGGSSTDLFRSSFDNFVDRPPNRGVTLTFSYPIFDWGRGVSRVAQESSTLKERELDLEDMKRTIIRETRDIVHRVNETRNRLEIHEKNQKVVQKSYDISRLRFENGDMTSQELGREQERLAETQLQYLDAFIAYQLAVADLKRKTLWDFKNNCSYVIDTPTEE